MDSDKLRCFVATDHPRGVDPWFSPSGAKMTSDHQVFQNCDRPVSGCFSGYFPEKRFIVPVFPTGQNTLRKTGHYSAICAKDRSGHRFLVVAGESPKERVYCLLPSEKYSWVFGFPKLRIIWPVTGQIPVTGRIPVTGYLPVTGIFRKSGNALIYRADSGRVSKVYVMKRGYWRDLYSHPANANGGRNCQIVNENFCRTLLKKF